MGLPDLPDNCNEDQNLPVNDLNINHFPNTSEDSEDDDPYDGYQPLPIEETQIPSTIDQNADDDDEDDLMNGSVTHGDPNLPNVISTDAEIEQEIWNMPRPLELGIELDNSKTEKILSVMSSISLPTTNIPSWVMDEKWKEDLLEKIRQRRVT